MLKSNITNNGFGYVSTGIIKHYQPKGLLEIDHLVYLNPEHPLLGPMTLTIKATEKEGRTALYLCQDGYQNGEEWDWYFEAVRKAWPIVVKILKDFLEEKNK
jgi:hypothetical protein